MCADESVGQVMNDEDVKPVKLDKNEEGETLWGLPVTVVDDLPPLTVAKNMPPLTVEAKPERMRASFIAFAPNRVQAMISKLIVIREQYDTMSKRLEARRAMHELIVELEAMMERLEG